MVTNISSKSELSSLSSKLNSQSTQLKSVSDGLRSLLTSIPDYEGIGVPSVGSVLASNIVNIAADMDAISKAIHGYITELEAFDVYDLNVDAELAGDKGVNNNPVNKKPVATSPSTPVKPSYGGSTGGTPTVNTEKDVYSPVIEQPSSNGMPNDLNNPTVNDENNVNDPIVNKPIYNNNNNSVNNPGVGQHVGSDKPNNLGNSTTNNSVGSSVVDKPSNNVSSNIGNGGFNSNSVNSSVGGMSAIDSVVVDDQVSTDVSDVVFSDDIYVNDDSGYVGQTNNNVLNSTNDSSNNSGSALPGILGGLGAAAAVGLGAVGGAKAIKKMKENQEIDDDDDDE